MKPQRNKTELIYNQQECLYHTNNSTLPVVYEMTQI